MNDCVIDRIQQCKDCIKYPQVLCTKPKPYVKFNVLENWKPIKVKVLFIAESPPKDRDEAYFYNDKTEGRLKDKIFNLLYIREETAEKRLQRFKERNFFLIDTLKCRLDKSKTKYIPQKVIKSCAENFLQQEIDDLKPDKICVLGRTALKGLKALTAFRKGLNDIRKITEHCGKELTMSGYKIILCVFPSNRNRKYQSCMECVFSRWAP